MKILGKRCLRMPFKEMWLNNLLYKSDARFPFFFFYIREVGGKSLRLRELFLSDVRMKKICSYHTQRLLLYLYVRNGFKMCTTFNGN